MTTAAWPAGAAYIDGRYMPIGEATIPITEWGYRRSDVTYDVVGVWGGAFFRLDDHIARFRRSREALRMALVQSSMARTSSRPTLVTSTSTVSLATSASSAA